VLTVEGGVKKMKIARIICWLLDSAFRPTMKRGFDIIPVCAGIDIKAAGDRTFSPVLHINIGMCQTTDVSCMMFDNKIGL
jgi:hypothetical protein